MSQPAETPQEHILVIPSSEFIAREPFEGFRPLEGRSDLGDYLASAPTRMGSFMPREEAETNVFFKQIIPYAAIMCEDSIFIYRRGKAGGEDRLHHKLSIGIGGHISREDDPEEPFWAFAKGAQRELREEIGLRIDHNMLQKSVIGLLHESQTPVGQVHLGVAMLMEVDRKNAEEVLRNCEDTICEARFVPIIDLEDPEVFDQLELWSQFFVRHIIEGLSVNGKWKDAAFRERVGMLSICAANLASASSGFLMQDTPRGHNLSRAHVARAAGSVQCMLAGLAQFDDVSANDIKTEAKAFHTQLGDILKYQHKQE